ncbi:MAG TPA: MmcQ/YjbR family DNA-binding protein [Bryobacteraceae bacterium]|nr:MmcQ/YjbR family DNA-binding protein [Bryobacteraceae bacterium]
MSPVKRRLLERLSKISRALPGTERHDQAEFSAFLVRKRPFAYLLDNHHGNGIVSIACRALPGDNIELARAQPERFYLPKYVGPRGWVALRLDIGKVDWEEVRELMACSYGLTAPKSRRRVSGPLV